MYKKPIVETTDMMPSSIMQTSPNVLNNTQQGTGSIPSSGDPIVGG